MAKFLVGLAWFLLVCDFSVLATVNLDKRQLIERLFELRERRQPSPAIQQILKANDKQLNFYALPIGQGDAQILQCPSGDITIIDLGSGNAKGQGFWETDRIRTFLQGHYQNIKNIVVTHNDKDHYSLFSEVFSDPGELSNLENIYISCDESKLEGSFNTWIEKLKKTNIGLQRTVKIQMFNEGNPCGSKLASKEACNPITLCPESVIETEVILANAGGCNKAKKSDYEKNVDSIVMRIKFNNFVMILNGDFERATPKLVSAIKIGPPITVYKLAHHGAAALANKNSLLKVAKPKAVFASSDPWYTYGHPRCSVFKELNKLETLCQPEFDSGDKSCGKHPIIGLSSAQRLQKVYTCAETQNGVLTRVKEITDFAIYTTRPSESKINLILLVTDGDAWGFVNNFYQLKRKISDNRVNLI